LKQKKEKRGKIFTKVKRTSNGSRDQALMESDDVKHAIDPHHNNNNDNTKSADNSSKTIIDSINNNINCLIERLQGESESVKSFLGCDESSLPSPKAMLETIMPCEKLCSSFRHIADELSASSVENALKIKSENEVKIGGEEDNFDFPLNLKALKQLSGAQKGSFNVSKMF
jgi:hypothetical protein